MLPRHPNYLWEQLAEDQLAASFIVDGHHLPDSFLRVALRAKGIERSVLVTDAVMPALCAPGPYRLGEVDVELLDDQRVVLRGGTRLAGSALRMDAAISNVMRCAGVSLTEAVTMATVNPARVGRIGGSDARIAAGRAVGRGALPAGGRPDPGTGNLHGRAASFRGTASLKCRPARRIVVSCGVPFPSS